MITTGSVVGGRYTVLSLIGEGGMSRVWLARDVNLNKLWAVKEVQRSSVEADGRKVFATLMTEAQLLKELDHPALPRVVDVLDQPDELVVVMDYVEGESLDKVLALRGGSVSEAEAVTWTLELCAVLSYLHSQDPPVVYRDMKPANIILTPQGSIKLIDFGIARRYKTGVHTDTQVLGTRGYAAPEQANPHVQSDARTDVYELGVTFYQLLSGANPAEEPFEMVPLRSIKPELSEGLDAVIWRATRPDPRMRYQSAQAMAQDLQHYQELTQQFRTAIQRRVRHFWLLAGAGVLMLALGAGCFLYQQKLQLADYDSLCSRALATDTTKVEGESTSREALLMQAIATDPQRPDAYSDVLRKTYLADAVFSEDESERWELLMHEQMPHIQNQTWYAKLCMETGMAYMVYTPDDSELAQATKAEIWFERAVQHKAQSDRGTKHAQNTSLTKEEQRSVLAYLAICHFYTNLERATAEGSEGELYANAWNSLKQEIAQLDDHDPLMVTLRLYQLTAQLLQSPAHATGLKRAGVTRNDAMHQNEILIQKTQALTFASQANQKTYALQQEILRETQQATTTITAVWGQAGDAV